jgi:hypothetical protein
MIFARPSVRFWFAWRPVRLRDGSIAWLEVVEIHRGMQIGDTKERKGGRWKDYTLANQGE